MCRGWHLVSSAKTCNFWVRSKNINRVLRAMGHKESAVAPDGLAVTMYSLVYTWRPQKTDEGATGGNFVNTSSCC